MTTRTGLILLATAAGLALAWLARDVLLLAFLGVLIAVVFSFPVNLMVRFLPRGLAVILVLLALAGILVALALIVAPQIADELDDLRQNAPRAASGRCSTVGSIRYQPGRLESRANRNISQFKFGHYAAALRLLHWGTRPVRKAGEKAVPALIAAVTGVTSALLVIVLGAFLVAAPETYRLGVRRLVPQEHEPVFDESYARVGLSLRKWVGAILVSMTIMGTLAAIGLRIAGIHDWLLLGFLTFLGTFVPYVGAIASALPGLLVALAQSPQHALYALLVYVAVHVIEGYLIAPLVMKRAVEVKPALLLAGQGAFAAIFGIPGTVIATPALVCAQTLIGYLWTERKLGK